jgi:pentatricopeptide repeat-containing protein PET309
MLYNTRGAYDICKQLFEAATRAKDDNSAFQAPIALLTAIMETHYKAKEYAEVERCWELARSEANRLVKTFHQITNPPPNPPTPAAEFESITDPSIKAQFESSRIATNRRQILFKASRIYIRSLLAQNDPKALQTAQRTVRSLLTSGFVIDNLTWNELIIGLTLRGYMIDAFSACEMYLMPNFPGWAELNPVYRRRYRPGYSWMEIRHYEIKRSSLLPRYKTLVVLAAALQQVKRDEMNGLGFNPQLGQWVREVLERIAPNTVRAIETMPRTGDELQKQYLLEI